MIGSRVSKFLKFVVIGVLAATLFTFVVRGLWNWLMPALFGLHLITFWQALGILILSKILFGGFRGRPGWGGQWRARMMERWEKMTPEEREKFREGLRCGGGRGRVAPPAPAADQKA
jgi:Ca2+/H+ antiporter, TMEM165/GDT1 family